MKEEYCQNLELRITNWEIILNLFMGLTRNDLSHYYYHRLLGLRKSANRKADNLDYLAGELNGSNLRLQALQSQQAAMTEQYYIVRLFYRFFNINNYAFNTYLVAAHDVYTVSQNERETVPTLEAGIPVSKERGLMQQLLSLLEYSARGISAGITYARDIVARYNPSLVIQFIRNYFRSNAIEQGRGHSEIGRILVTNVVAPVADHLPAIETASGKQFCIIEAMHAPLQVLGIDGPNGGMLSWADVKTAYRQKALSTHPDRGHLNTEFHAVKEALDRLQELIFDEPQSDAELSTQWDWYFSEIHSRFDNIERLAARAERASVATMRSAARILELLCQADAQIIQQTYAAADGGYPSCLSMKRDSVRQQNFFWPRTDGPVSMPLYRQVSTAKQKYLMDVQPDSVVGLQLTPPRDERLSTNTALTSP